MQPIVTDRVARSVCQSVALVSPAKTYKPRDKRTETTFDYNTTVL